MLTDYEEIEMSVCKQCGAVNGDEKKFCSECGYELNAFEPGAVQQALDTVDKEFSRDMRAGMDKSKLTFICDVCGKVNPIDVPGHRCSRCGKKMPRNTYVKALKSIKNAPDYSEPVVKVPTFGRDNAPQEQQYVQEVPQQTYVGAQQVYRMTGKANPPQQNNSIVQPFVIVPYVSQNQPLLQYNPNTVYRYHKFTEEEKRENLKDLARIEKAQEEEEQRRAEARGDVAFKKSNIRPMAIIAIILAVIALVAVYAMPFILPDGVDIAGSNFKFDLIDSNNSLVGILNGSANFPDDPMGIVSVVLQCLFVASMLGTIVQSVVRIVRNDKLIPAFIFPSIALISGIAVHIIYGVGCGFENIYPTGLFAAIAMVVIPLVVTIVAACAHGKKLKK